MAQLPHGYAFHVVIFSLLPSPSSHCDDLDFQDHESTILLYRTTRMIV